jgi:hypothetical protein
MWLKAVAATGLSEEHGSRIRPVSHGDLRFPVCVKKCPEVIAAKERHRMSDYCKGFDPSANVWWWILNAPTPRSDPHIAGEVDACADNEIASGYFVPILSGQVLNAFL